MSFNFELKVSWYHCRYKKNFEIARAADCGNRPESRVQQKLN